MLYFFVTLALGVCEIYLGASCKSYIFYAVALILCGIGLVWAVAMETKCKNIYLIISSIIYTLLFAYAAGEHDLYEIYCADFELVAAQMFAMAIYTLLSIDFKSTKKEAQCRVLETQTASCL